MFILRLIWIIVFLAASSVLPSFPMVECKPVPSATSTTDPRDEQLLRTTTVTRSTFSAGHVLSSSSTLWRRHEEETEEASEDAEDDLQTTITRKYALHSVCSGRNIHLMGKRLNHVRADATPKSHYAQLTVKSVRPGEISISNDQSRRFLCFNRHGKLIMRLEFRDKACVFHERVQQKHMVLQSSYNKTWFVGFGRDGKSLLGSDWQKKLPKNRGCYNFLKTGEKFFASLNDVSQDETPEHHRKVHRLSQKHFKVPATVHLESLPSLTVNAKKTLPSSPLHSSV